METSPAAMDDRHSVQLALSEMVRSAETAHAAAAEKLEAAYNHPGPWFSRNSNAGEFRDPYDAMVPDKAGDDEAMLSQMVDQFAAHATQKQRVGAAELEALAI